MEHNTPSTPARKQKVAVLGGDARQQILADMLAKAGYESALFGIDCTGTPTDATRSATVENAVNGADLIVLPLPYSSDNVRINCPLGSCDVRLTDLFSMLPRGTMVAGGRFNDTAIALAERAGVRLYDYYNSEEVSILNTVPTAEGAIAIAMQHLPITLHGSHSVVLGFGRCGKTLAKQLSGLGANVTVTARRQEDLAWIAISGYRAIRTGDPAAWQTADVLFNTIPYQVLNQAALDTLSPETLIIDLASRPGGVDIEAASERGIRVVRALSLPGKVAPVSAGKIIAGYVFRLLRGESV